MTTKEESLHHLQEKLEHLKTVERPDAIKMLQETRSRGDLSENEEYHVAREQQATLEDTIRNLENRILQLQTQKVTKSKSDSVSIGSHVSIEREGTVSEIDIVEPEESDPVSGAISLDSPLGAALMGHKAGDTVDITLPRGVSRVIIKRIS